MLTAAEIEQYSRLIEQLQSAADEQTIEGRVGLANMLVCSRQSLRGILTKALELQQLAQETDEILSGPRPQDGAPASRLS